MRSPLLTLLASALALLAFAAAASASRLGQSASTAPRAELAVDHDSSGSGKPPGFLEATIAANQQATTYHVEYGPDDTYGSNSDELPAGADKQPVDRVVELPLPPGGPFHARVVATNGSGWSASADLEFWVAAAGGISDSASDNSGPGDDGGTQGPAGAKPPGDHDGDGSDSGPAPAPPALGKNVVLHPRSGSVRFRAPGKRVFVPLATGVRVPVGSLVDTRDGHVALESARDAHGRTQTGTFWGAVFQVRQHRDSRGVTDIVLRGGSFAHCGAIASASALAREAGGRRPAVRRLWGKDNHSRFRTHGRDSVATVRGTEWVTTDRCDGTLTRVRKGAVLVRDLHRKRRVLLTAGHAYFARHHRH
jgi:hypothetical protein